MVRAKVQDAITRGLFAAGCAIARPPFPLYRRYEHGYIDWDVTKRPSANNSPMFSVSRTDKPRPRPLIKTRDANRAGERDRVSAN